MYQLTDQGLEIESEFLAEEPVHTSIKHPMTNTYYPQKHSQMQRFHQAIVRRFMALRHSTSDGLE